MPLLLLSLALIAGAIMLPPHSPSPSYAYYWSDQGARYAEKGDLPRARACFWRALELSAEVPQIWLRDANFHFEMGENDAGLATSARVLRKVPDYDGVLFSYFDQASLAPSRVLDRIAADRRPARAYTEYLIATQRLASATEAWSRLSTEGHLDDRLTSSFIDLLLRHQHYEQAAASWAAYLDTRRRDYPSRNLLFNGSFEVEPTGCALDWRISPAEPVQTLVDTEVTHSGNRSLRIRFPGTTNVNYAHTSQTVPVRPGSYRLTVWVRTVGITTKEGPRVEIFDTENSNRLFVASEPFVETSPWTPFELRFTVTAATHLITVRIARRTSPKFDNKIAGTVWFDELVLGLY